MERSTDYWKSQAAACQPALLADLAPLIAIESVCDESAATPEAPFGPGPAAALDYMLALARRDQSPAIRAKCQCGARGREGSLPSRDRAKLD